jgi:hypothetical protein
MKMGTIINRKYDIMFVRDDGLLHTFKNNLNLDSMFVKVMVLQGSNYSQCIYGANIQYQQSNIQGVRCNRIATQLPQNAYNSLGMPYAFNQLTRSSNFLENLVVSSSTSKDYTKEYSPIIPNTQLIVKCNREYKWTIELFVNPSSKLLWIMVCCVVVLIVFLVLICILYAKEKSEEKACRLGMVIT